MSFFLPHKLSCFICHTLIAERVDAAQMFYASPDEVGELARFGRGWVHRCCWETWSLREAWSQSAAKLMERDAANLLCDRVSCRPSSTKVLLQDLWCSTAMTIPFERLAELRAALQVGGEVPLDASLWRFELLDGEALCTARSEGELIERFAMTPARWLAALQPL